MFILTFALTAMPEPVPLSRDHDLHTSTHRRQYATRRTVDAVLFTWINAKRNQQAGEQVAANAYVVSKASSSRLCMVHLRLRSRLATTR